MNELKAVIQDVLNLSTEERATYMTQHGDVLLEDMLMNIGSPDEMLRDQAIYSLFMELLVSNQLLKDTMEQLVCKLATDDYLFYGIGTHMDDSVFTRSYAALWLAGLLRIDMMQSYLSEEAKEQLYNKATQFLQREKDVRGYVDGKGWANAISHIADLLALMIRHDYFEVKYGVPILQGVQSVFWKGQVLVDDEEERLVEIASALIEVDFPEEVMVEWVEQVFDQLQLYLMQRGYTRDYFTARTMTLHFMKTLYFALKYKQKYPQLLSTVAHFIAKNFKVQ
ncbi:DUF2785 domain-containing protein [Caryophanon latum]|uniref:DUF2785 domain-containing protein n=1 Tax=Caryophanon latum TaxID=33977 RepID=A0A1C0YTG7_9BACL|nr:DUF2785 domain-containing protein [Caryophanon latum]OCS90466.1 hypothetical protein A6K76_11410 [Caryophanon latum]